MKLTTVMITFAVFFGDLMLLLAMPDYTPDIIILLLILTPVLSFLALIIKS